MGEDELPIFSAFTDQPPLVPVGAKWLPVSEFNMSDKAVQNDGCWVWFVRFPARTKLGLTLEKGSTLIDMIDPGSSDTTGEHFQNGLIATEDVSCVSAIPRLGFLPLTIFLGCVPILLAYCTHQRRNVRTEDDSPPTCAS